MCYRSRICADYRGCLFSEINNLIMDYLISEGYPSSAGKFATEANIQPRANVESIQERIEIRNAIHTGDIQSAIEKINELNPHVRNDKISTIRHPSVSLFLL